MCVCLRNCVNCTGVCAEVCICVSWGCTPSLWEPMKETLGAQTSCLPPPASLTPSCQVVAEQQNKVNHSPTRAFSSTNEGVLPCTNECVRVFACYREPIIHHACSQTSFRSRLLPNSGELLLCVHVDVHAVCLCLPPLQSFAAL